MSTHQDSVLWVVGVVICLAMLFQYPKKETFLLNVIFVPPLFLAIILNNRRLAFVAIAFAAMAIYGVANQVLRRRVHRLLIVVVPVALLYTMVGWKAQGLWARPVQVLKSITDREDTSSLMRDVENYNLVVTAKARPVLGWGFGHEYIEKIKGISIEEFLEAYRYLPHNSLLWLVGAGGIIGFTCFWMMHVVGAFMAVRVYRFSRFAIDKIAALTTLGVILAYAVQGYGDSGLFNWMTSMLLGMFLGVVAARAPHVGAWPQAPENGKL